MSSVVTVRDLRRKTPRELQKILTQLRDQMRELSFELRIGHVKKVHGARQLRKSIAKVLTIQHEQKQKAPAEPMAVGQSATEKTSVTK